MKPKYEDYVTIYVQIQYQSESVGMNLIRIRRVLQNDKCRYNPATSKATDKGFVDIPKGDEKKLAIAVASVGPVSVAIDASHESFQFYSNGQSPELITANM